MKGKFIVIYGSNNLGKTTQIELLIEKLQRLNIDSVRIKYPIYNLEPTGPLINKILRHEESLDRSYSEKEIQTIYAQNRHDYQSTLEDYLSSGKNVIAEDYTGTGIAWGITRDLDIDTLEEINKELLLPDFSILLDSETRFISGIEKSHKNEGSAKEGIWIKNRDIHRELAKRYQWKIINANQTRENVHNSIWQLIKDVIIK